MNVVFYADVTKVAWKDIKSKIEIIHPKEREKINNLRNEKDRILALTGKIVLLYMLVKYTNWTKNYLPELAYTSHGKPYVKDSSFAFNISHSGNLVVCACRTKGKIGIDIEQVQALNIEEYCAILSEEEQAYLSKKDQSEFFKVWTCKEAIIKADGRAFSLNLKKINTIKGFKFKSKLRVEKKQWFVFFLNIHDDYTTTLVSDSPLVPITESVFI